MAISYYPVQRVSLNGDIKGVQSASIDFNSNKTEFYGFGIESRIGYANLQSPSVSAKIQYILTEQGSNGSIYSNFLTDNPQYSSCYLDFLKGKMQLISGQIVGYSLKAQAASVVTSEIDVLGLNASYSSNSAGGNAGQGGGSIKGAMTAAKLSFNGLDLKSFNVNINVPKKIVYTIGKGPELVNFKKPKISIELEYILGGQTVPNFTSYNGQFSCNSRTLIEIGGNQPVNMIKHSSQGSTSEIGTIKISYEAEITKNSDVKIYY